jgi:hypothetical protein
MSNSSAWVSSINFFTASCAFALESWHCIDADNGMSAFAAGAGQSLRGNLLAISKRVGVGSEDRTVASVRHETRPQCSLSRYQLAVTPIS